MVKDLTPAQFWGDRRREGGRSASQSSRSASSPCPSKDAKMPPLRTGLQPRADAGVSASSAPACHHGALSLVGTGQAVDTPPPTSVLPIAG